MDSKIIFLDIGGVLNNAKFKLKNPEKKSKKIYQFNTENIEQFNRIVKETNASIVITSSLRVQQSSESPGRSCLRSVEDLQKILDDAGCICKVIGTTAFTPQVKKLTRFSEIRQYINENALDDLAFIVIDDCNVYHGSKFIITNPETGLTEQDADKAIMILNRQIQIARVSEGI